MACTIFPVYLSEESSVIVTDRADLRSAVW